MTWYICECGTRLVPQKVKKEESDKPSGTFYTISGKVFFVTKRTRYICPNNCILTAVTLT